MKSSSLCFLPRYLCHWLQLPRGPQGESPHPGPDFGCAQRRGHRPLRGGLHRGGTETRSAALRGHQRRLPLGAFPARDQHKCLSWGGSLSTVLLDAGPEGCCGVLAAAPVSLKVSCSAVGRCPALSFSSCGFPGCASAPGNSCHQQPVWEKRAEAGLSTSCSSLPGLLGA